VRRTALSIFILAAAAFARSSDRLDLAWPTPNPAWGQGRSIEAFIQPTGSGDPKSGCYGGVRDGGLQFHEGIDIKAMVRDRHGEPKDPVFAALPGVVRHVSRKAGDSNYGRYIVIEHPDVTPAVYTLYAHLASVAPAIAEGVRVERGQTIGVMGHSSNGSISRDRAHLHFEMGLLMTRDFQTWYIARGFGSPNDHGIWNGMNLMGFDPLDFFDRWRERKIDNVQDYFKTMHAQVRLRIATHKIPDFIQRYPSLLRAPMPMGLVGGWEIECDWTGIPFAWWPLTPAEVAGMTPNHVDILEVDRASAVKHRAKVLVRARGSGYAPGRDLEIVLQQLFGLR
jgi:murein DD-endopeptidase MepM/ murein hydrolase activator NlpD